MDNFGGGFMSQGFGPQGDGILSPGQGRQNRDKQSITPLTIKQLNSATNDGSDDKPKIDGIEVHHIRLVACIISVAQQTTGLTYTIEDGSGRIDVRVFAENDEPSYMAERRMECRENCYVSVIGSLKWWQDKISVQCYDMRPIRDHNEITTHFLSVIHAHLVNTRGPPLSQTVSRAVPTNYQSNVAFTSHMGPQVGGGFDNYRNAIGTQQETNKISSVQMQVLDLFKMYREPKGLHVDEVINSMLMASNFTRDMIQDAIMELSSEGLIYTTFDEAHFKSTV